MALPASATGDPPAELKDAGKRPHRKGEAVAFYKRVLESMTRSGIPFALGGAYALRAHTDVIRDTKDLDIFCAAGNFTKIMNFLRREGFETKIADPRWLGKAFLADQPHFADIIFASASGFMVVSEDWIRRAQPTMVHGYKVKALAPEELIHSKIFVQDRDRYDGADVNHLILRKGAELDWKRLLGYADAHWELFLSSLINFMFVYPGDRDKVPDWVLNELLSRLRHLSRLKHEYEREKICRGPLLAREQYEIDTQKWGYRTIT